MRTLRMGLVLLMVAAVACTGEPGSVLDRGPRVADDEGIVEDIGPAGLKLEGGRGYEIHGEVESFTTRAHNVVRLPQLKGRYVHLGLDDQERVVWIASIGIVPKGRDDVYYDGVLERVEDGLAYFDDGTVLRLGPGVEPPDDPGPASVVLHARQKVVIELKRV